jgi:asparagine synthetase B (glutamine-hydrolysing)
LRFDREMRRNDPMFDAPLRLLFRNGILPLVPKPLKQMVKPLFIRDELPFSIAPEFARRARYNERMSRQPVLPRCRDLAQQDVYRTYSAGWMAQALEPVDRYAASAGIEMRHPFYDRRVMEFAFAIPESQRLRGLETKFVLRRAMRGIVPASILARLDKGSFGYTFPEAMREFGGERIFDSLEIEQAGWVDSVRVKEAYRKMESLYTAGDVSYVNYISELWVVLAVEFWFSETFGRGRVAVGKGQQPARAPAEERVNDVAGPAQMRATILKGN